MGDWNITIKGVGAHHNKSYPQDANRMAAKFVEELRKAGHSVTHASFTFGGAEDLADPAQASEEALRQRFDSGG